MRKAVLTMLTIFGLLSPSIAQAASASDALAECLIESSTGKDRLAMIEWFFAALTSHPAVTQYSSLTPEQKAAISQKLSDVVVKLLTVDCRAQALAALRSGDPTAMRTAFGEFGKIAASDLMANPTVQGQLAEVSKDLNTPAVLDLLKEAKQKP